MEINKSTILDKSFEPVRLDRFVFEGFDTFGIPEWLVKSYYDDAKNKVLKITFRDTEALPLLKLSNYFNSRKEPRYARLVINQLDATGATLYRISYSFIHLDDFGDFYGDYCKSVQREFDAYFTYRIRDVLR